MKSKTIKLLDRNRREYFHDLGIDKDFLNMTPDTTNDKGNLKPLRFRKQSFRPGRGRPGWKMLSAPSNVLPRTQPQNVRRALQIKK